MDLTNLKRQHEEIYMDIEYIIGLINDANLMDKLPDFVSKINRFAGRIQIHLNSEDKVLYPHLLEDDRYSAKAKEYINEMGDLLDEFIVYKTRYNTKSKIEVNESSLKTDTVNIMKKIGERMSREDDDLYKMIL